MEDDMADFIRTDNDQFVLGGQPVILRGLGVGSWLNLEHFMMGVPGWDFDLRKCLDEKCANFMDRFTKSFFSLEDAHYLRSLGVNFIRVPMNHHLFWDDETDSSREFGFLQLKRLAAICEQSGLYFMPDLHTTPGGQNPDWHSESRTGTAQFWEFAVLRSRAVALWREIARCLKDSTALLGYDLLNEPVLHNGNTEPLNAFYRDAIKAIREEDLHHIVFLEGDRFSMDFSKIIPPEDDNWAYTYHFYPAVWDEKLLDTAISEESRAGMFENALGEILNSMGGYRGPLLCGEMGYELSCLEPSFGIRLTGSTIKSIESHHSSWCLWCYKDAHFMGLTYPNENSGWMRLVKAVHANWDHHRASKLGFDAVSAIEKLCPYFLSSEEKYRMQFVIRAMAAHADVEHILAPALDLLPQEKRDALPQDFALDLCDRNNGLEELLKCACAIERTMR
jgi:aryl-phospho-beta-D-glucosidase BglC (GH1 family)